MRAIVSDRVKNGPKAFVFGVDGGSFDVIDPLVAQGLLPNMAALLREGASAVTETTWPPHTAPGWTSLVAGSTPGRHGVYQFFATQDENYRARILGTHDFGCSTVWEWLASAGWTMGLINIPMSHPPRDLPGYQITWPLTQTLRYCSPSTLLGEMASSGVSCKSDLTTMFHGKLHYIHEALGNIRARGETVKYLLRERPVDAVMMVITESDRVCHHYWHFSETDHPQHCAPADPAYTTAIRDTYIAIDQVLGEVLELLDEDCTVVMVSDHGFGSGRDSLSLHTLLEENGFLHAVCRGNDRDPPGSEASWFSDPERRIAWNKTRVYMPVPGSFGVNVNLRGRQREGTCDISSMDDVLNDVAALCMEQRSPRTGVPAFNAVLRREEAFPGEYSHLAPDLLLMPHDESLMVTADLGVSLWGHSTQTGLHRFEGIWVHRSPRTVPGRLPQSVRLIDVMPTLLADLDVPIPESVPGCVVQEAFASLGSLRRFRDGVGIRSSSGAHAQWEEEELTGRLRSMGYL